MSLTSFRYDFSPTSKSVLVLLTTIPGHWLNNLPCIVAFHVSSGCLSPSSLYICGEFWKSILFYERFCVKIVIKKPHLPCSPLSFCCIQGDPMSRRLKLEGSWIYNKDLRGNSQAQDCHFLPHTRSSQRINHDDDIGYISLRYEDPHMTLTVTSFPRYPPTLWGDSF